MSRLGLTAAAVALVAASAGPVAAQEAPPAAAWQRAVDDYLGRTLKDPYSAVKRQTSDVFYGPIKYPAGRVKRISWAVCFVINAKNSYGAYIGEQSYLFLLDPDGSISEALPSDRHYYSQSAAAMDRRIAQDTCASRTAAGVKEFTVPKGDEGPHPKVAP